VKISKVPIFAALVVIAALTFDHTAWEIPFRLAFKSENEVGNVTGCAGAIVAFEVGLAAATFFHVYLDPVLRHFTDTPLAIEIALGLLQGLPILVAA
jgi:hypothetical protein